MKTLLYTSSLFLSFCFLLTSCSADDIIQENAFCNQVTINIQNETGTDIQDFSLGDKTWDNLEDGTTIQNICFNELTLDGGFPMIYFTGIMDGSEIKSVAHLHWCGTGMYSVTDGVYNIQIIERMEWDMELVNYEYSEEE